MVNNGYMINNLYWKTEAYTGKQYDIKNTNLQIIEIEPTIITTFHILSYFST